MTREDAQRLAEQLESLATIHDDGTTLGHNVAVEIRACADEIRAEAEFLEHLASRTPTPHTPSRTP